MKSIIFIIILVSILEAKSLDVNDFQVKGITASPDIACKSSRLTLTAEIDKSPLALPLEYQWYFGSAELLSTNTAYTGVTTPVLTINKIVDSDTGTYMFIALRV